MIVKISDTNVLSDNTMVYQHLWFLPSNILSYNNLPRLFHSDHSLVVNSIPDYIPWSLHELGTYIKKAND